MKDTTSSNLWKPVLVKLSDYFCKRVLYDKFQISYGRFYANTKGNCELDLFIMQADGKKIVDPNKQNALRSRLRMELSHPVRISVMSRGPDTELLVANPVELSGRGRPLVFHDITLALKNLDIHIFSVLDFAHPFIFLYKCLCRS